MKKKHILKIGCGMLILALCLSGCAAPAAPEETAPPTTAIPETTAAAQTTVPETMSPQERESVAEFNRMMEELEALSAYHVAYRFIMSGQGQTLGNQGWTEIWVDGEDYFYLNHKELPDIPAYDYGYLYLDGVTYGYNIVQSEDDIPDTWKVLDEAFRFAAWADVFHQPEQPTRLVEHTREGDKQTITVLRGEEETNNGVLYSPMTLTVTAEGEQGLGHSVLRTVFPTARELEGRYPYLKEKPWLLPGAWVQRLARYAGENRGRAGAARESVAIGERRVALLKKYGVIP